MPSKKDDTPDKPEAAASGEGSAPSEAHAAPGYPKGGQPLDLQSSKLETRRVSLALQGGGSHGAFTWGALDCLLEDGRIDFAGICGTSAGSLNGAILAAGLLQSRDEARRLLKHFWRRVGDVAATMAPFGTNLFDKVFGGASDATAHGNPLAAPFIAPFTMMAENFAKMFSPYQFNPLGYNPLRELLAEVIDFEALRRVKSPALFACATNVRRSSLRVFNREEMSMEVLLASTCLPTVFQAVEINGEAYWDGGYMGNPALYPLIHEAPSNEILIIQINPIHRDKVPETPEEITDRINEISFNASLLNELKAISLVNAMIEEHDLEKITPLKRIKVHMLADEHAMAAYAASSKMNADPALLDELFKIGRAAAQRWLMRHFGDAPGDGKDDKAAKPDAKAAQT